MSSRRDASKQSGWVNFPAKDPAFRNTAEGGMSVHALFVATASISGGEDPFVHNCSTDLGVMRRGGPTFSADITNVAVEMFGESNDEMSDFTNDNNATYGLLACVCLGSSGGSFLHDALGQFWACRREDLTEDGRQLLLSLERLYGRRAILLTTLDT